MVCVFVCLCVCVILSIFAVKAQLISNYFSSNYHTTTSPIFRKIILTKGVSITVLAIIINSTFVLKL